MQAEEHNFHSNYAKAEAEALVLNKKEVQDQALDIENFAVLDSFQLSQQNYRKGILQAVLFTAAAIFVFFVPLTINGETDITFGIVYNGLMQFTGVYGLWFISILVALTGLLSIYGKWIAKSGPIYDYFEGDSPLHPILYNIGGIFAILYTFHATTNFNGPQVIVGASTGGTVIPDIAVAVFWIILTSSFFMPLLVNYGLIDFVGSMMEPLMRPAFKLPGRAAVNALVSFVSSSSVGVLITNKLYRRGVYTEKEAVLVATGFSAVSIGFAYMVISVAGLETQFAFIYLISSIMTLIVSGVVARIPPFSNKRDIYLDGRVQTDEDRNPQRTGDNSLIKDATDRAVKKAYLAPNLGAEVWSSLKDSLSVIPKVVTSVVAIGVGALILAEYTPVFDWIGQLFVPLLNLLRVPNAELIAPSFPVGIAEMFLPVLLIADKVDQIEPGARFLVTSVSISQIIFFAETAVVMLSAKLPLKAWELVVVFFERTIIAIIIGALFMHLLF